MASPPAVCRCGHVREAHDHFRAGTDCGVCGPVECPRFRRDPNPGAARPSGLAAEAAPAEEERVTEVDSSI